MSCFYKAWLLRPHPSTIDIERLASDKCSIVAGEKRYCADQIVRYLDTLDRLHSRDCGEFLVHGLKTGAWRAHESARRTGKAWRDCIDGDAVTGKIASQCAREPNNAAFARDVVRKAGHDRAQRARCHVDDAAPLAGTHV